MKPTAHWRDALGRALPCLLLAGQNLAVFFRHYFGDFGFPWDFLGSYYALPAFWTSVVHRGIFPQWVPFQSMGYPLAINLQSGIYYPFFWIFPLFQIPFTLHAAVVFQCLHVFFGAVGMFLLLRLVLGSSATALVGAAAFQFFGGFYSNAEHADIVRSFALVPWFLYSLTRTADDGNRLPRRSLLLSLLVFLLATGGYPGNLLAALLLGAVYGSTQLLETPRSTRSWKTVLVLWASYAGLALLGLLMACAQLLPAWLFRQDMARWYVYAKFRLTVLGLEHLPGMVFSNRGLPGDISMTSTYVSLLLLVAVCFLQAREAKKHLAFLILLLTAAVMAGGNRLFLYRGLALLAPPFGFSRYPASDYREFVAIGVIVLGAAALKGLAERGLGRRTFLLRAGLAFSLLTALASRVPRAGGDAAAVPLAFTSCLACLLLVLLAARRRQGLTSVFAAACLALVAADGVRVLPRIPTWRLSHAVDTVETLSALHQAGQVVSPAIFQESAHRPPRTTRGQGGYIASGYLTGEYGAMTAEGTYLTAKTRAQARTVYRDYILEGWRPILLPPVRPIEREIDVPERVFSARSSDGGDSVEQLSYGINEIRYRMHLAEPSLMIENETFFQGWKAKLYSAGRETEIPAIRANGIFRSWQLPAGRYAMRAFFRFPSLFALAAPSVVGWTVWLTLLGLLRRRLP